MTTQGGSIIPVRVINSSELVENGGYLKIIGKKVIRAERITDLTGRQVKGGSLLPVYIIEESALTDNMSVEGGKVLPIVYSTDLPETRQSLGKNPMLALLVGGVIPPPPALTFLLLDCFITTEAAPMTSPRTCEPGPGTLTIFDSANKMSISGGQLVISGGTGNKDPRAYDAGGHTRASGLTFCSNNNPNGAGNHLGWTFSSTGAGLYSSGGYNSRFFLSDANVYASHVPAVGTIGTEPWHFVLLNEGCFLFAMDTPVLVFPDTGFIETTFQQTLYPVTAARTGGSAAYVADYFAVAQLDSMASFAGDLCSPGEGVGTSRIDTPTAGDGLIHNADCKLRFQVDIVATTRVNFRIEDADPTDHLRVQVLAGGDIRFLEVTDGSAVIRFSAIGVINVGSIVEIVVDGVNAEGFVDGVSFGTYGSLLYTTGTTGEFDLGTGNSSLVTLTNAGSSNFASGLDHDQIAGPLALTDTFTTPSGITSDFIAQFEVITLPTTVTEVSFNRQDALNKWIIETSNTGDLQLVEVVGGAVAPRISAIGVLSGGETITLIMDGQDAYLYYDDNSAGTYGSAVTFRSVVNGLIDSLNGAWLTNFTVRQRYPSVDVLTDLQAIAAGCS